MAHHPDHNDNPSTTEHFQDVLERARLSRRNLIRGGFGLAALSALPFAGAQAAPGAGSLRARPQPKLGFGPVPKNLLDQVSLPNGYRFTVVHATGDRLSPAIAAYSNTGSETDDWSMRVGDHHDGMDLFFIDADGRHSEADTGRALLVVNHESSADAHFFHPTGQTTGGVSGKKFSQFDGWDLLPRDELEVLKEINHHGVSICEIRRVDGRWTPVIDSPLNRRVTGQSPVGISGPTAHIDDIRAFMVTRHDPSGASARGTLNNCGHGKTPWGTYLACEENWAAYFFMPKGAPAVDAKTLASRARYGVARTALSASATSAGSQGWSSVSASDDRFARFNVAPIGASAADDFRNEPNTFGFNVEIDPLTGEAVKRVAMGRFAHEAAVCSLPVAGQPLAFYMGCDSRNEYIYKFVSAAVWDPADAGRGLTAGAKYLDEGRLYAAKFDIVNDQPVGQWIELTIDDPRIAGHRGYAFTSQADVFINARHAADAVGATRMDRPEWGAINPKNGEVYFALTNNSTLRNLDTTDGANPRAYKDADGRAGSGNPNGHIIRFREQGAVAATATAFTWDIFLFGAEADADPSINLSQLADVNDFSSPDGLWFSPSTGICWIQTDDGAYTDVTHCMLLAAIPGEVGDGGKRTLTNTLNGVSDTQETFVGATLGPTRLRRFLVGPAGCEVTGLTETPDGKTLFVNIQHPGESSPAYGSGPFQPQSQWPGNAGYGPVGRPRSATIAITRTDGGVIGL